MTNLLLKGAQREGAKVRRLPTGSTRSLQPRDLANLK